MTDLPEWLEDYRVCLVDASDYSKQGSFNADFRFHSMVELFTLNMAEFHSTQASEGETISRYETIQEKDIIIADRAYDTIKGMKYVVGKKADFMFRLKAKSFHFYTQKQEVFDLTAYLQENYEPGKFIDMPLFYKSGKKYQPVRICALGKNEKDIEKSHRHIKKSNSKENRGKITDLQQIYSKLVFKRLKSIFGGEFCAKKRESVEAWFYGKLLLATICEIFIKRGRFSPCNQNQDDWEQ